MGHPREVVALQEGVSLCRRRTLHNRGQRHYSRESHRWVTLEGGGTGGRGGCTREHAVGRQCCSRQMRRWAILCAEGGVYENVGGQ